MRIDIVTLFPELCDSFLSASILGRARAKNLFEAHCHQIRDYYLNSVRSSEMNDWLKTSHSSIVLAMMCSASL